MSELFLLKRMLIFIVIFAGVLLAFWVYSADRRNKINKTFFLLTTFTLLWIILSYLGAITGQQRLALLLKRLNFAALSPFFVTTYFFSLYFPREGKRYPILDKIVLGVGVVLIFVAAFTNLVIKNIEFKEWGVNLVMGKASLFFYIAISLFSLLVLFNFFKKYFELSRDQKLRIQYFLVGVLFITLFNFIFNIFLPIFSGSYKYDWLGDYSFIFVIGFTAYAIVKQELFGIRVILTQALVGVIAILLLAQSITAIPNWIEFSWKFVLFLLFLFFGYLLIQSVIWEIQRRAELQRLYEEVDKLSRAKSEFLSIASHQLRTPLTAIKGYISMILEGSYGKFEEKGKPPLEKVYQSNERLIRLVNDLLNVSRIESGTLMTDFQKTSVEKMITSIIDELKIKADERKLYLNWQKPGRPLPEIMADTDKLRQVIMNIIDNAIKYTEKGGITVRAELKDPSAKWPQGKILIEIKDTGEGMEKDEMDNMFGSFTRGRAGAKHWVSGLGLGLYIAKKFTELHGGKIWVESEGEGKGSTFYIELPVK
jgi:signal transduction histidine kinase